MRKIFLMPLMLITLLFATTSCEKMSSDKEDSDDTITQIVNATVKEGDTYTFILPLNTTHDEFQITTQASHYSLSLLGKDTEGNLIYQYTSATGYKGPDKVIISTVEEQHSTNQGHSHNGGCNQNHESEQDMVIIINITVVPQG